MGGGGVGVGVAVGALVQRGRIGVVQLALHRVVGVRRVGLVDAQVR